MVTVQTEKKIPVFHIMHNIGVFCPNSTPHNTMTTYSTKLFLPFHSTKKTSVMKKDTKCLAYIKAGRINDMFALLNKVWGNWLQQGYTRFPENFSPEVPLKQQLTFYERPFGLSLCHGANGVPPIIGILHGIYGFHNQIKISPTILYVPI